MPRRRSIPALLANAAASASPLADPWAALPSVPEGATCEPLKTALKCCNDSLDSRKDGGTNREGILLLHCATSQGKGAASQPETGGPSEAG